MEWGSQKKNEKSLEVWFLTDCCPWMNKINLVGYEQHFLIEIRHTRIK